MVLATSSPIYQDEDSPAKYDFSYSVHDTQTGDIKQQHEVRDGDSVQGQYSLVDADGLHRIVDYTADDVNGFQATVRREPITKPLEPIHPVAVVASPVVKYVSAAPIAHYSDAAPVATVYTHAAPVAHRYTAASPITTVYHSAPSTKYVSSPVTRYHVASPVARYTAPSPISHYTTAPIYTARVAPLVHQYAPLSGHVAYHQTPAHTYHF